MTIDGLGVALGVSLLVMGGLVVYYCRKQNQFLAVATSSDDHGFNIEDAFENPVPDPSNQPETTNDEVTEQVDNLLNADNDTDEVVINHDTPSVVPAPSGIANPFYHEATSVGEEECRRAHALKVQAAVHLQQVSAKNWLDQSAKIEMSPIIKKK